ncbi:hypothetical protein [Flavobacterium chungangensis]|uniref:Uncharacterized protein n=1 Tax=Flavobacterium chungangensis TaxID=2708132 RepID=A0ABV8ZC96_9FLAO
MASTELKNIFLSASTPLEERNPKYYSTSDIIAIRDSVIALASSVIPNHRLVWGGHPSITPLINYVLQKLGLNIQERVGIYQSKFFERFYPEDNNQFKNIWQTDDLGERESSLLLMRKTMLNSCDFSAGVFIGGMEGVEEEYLLFREIHPNALVIVVESTGAAAKIIYDNYLPEEFKNERLIKDYGYMSLFQHLLIDKI